ncbi:hypothetical protein MKX01_039400 [Papaver californicum]|nr:hypothetical protein MKX01_039400 [Papaver californicum]
MSSTSRTIVWFRKDLRIDDNPALAPAARDGQVLPVYIWCPKEEGQFYPVRVSRWWLQQSLVHLNQSLKSLGVSLVFIKAESTVTALLQCFEAVGATKIVYNHLYDPVSLVCDHTIKVKLAEHGICVQSFKGDLLYDPWEVYDEEGNAFTTFNAFWDKCVNLSIEPASIFPPWKLVPPAGTVDGCSIEELGLEDELEKSSNTLLGKGWSPGWTNADKTLAELVDQGVTSSLLSPYLHFGEVSVRKVFQWNVLGEKNVKLFLRSLGLREYSCYLCFNFPFTQERSLMNNFRFFPWRSEHGDFKAWRQGKTGYPLVDAGMRELWATGWMHNRIRVIAASFFVKVLLLPWTWGMKYFWDTLLDADLESDILGWQYISGSLPDGHKLNRLDSPQVQGCKFDPEGEYVRQWLPELARMPSEWIHHPWNAPSLVLRAAGVELGLNYPKPVIDIDLAKKRLADALSTTCQTGTTARRANANGMEEVVIDNMDRAENWKIPVVVLKENVSHSTSLSDQRVPSFQSCKNAGRPSPIKIQSNDCESETSGAGGLDLHSTAESTSAKRQSTSSSFLVPDSSLNVEVPHEKELAYAMKQQNEGTSMGRNQLEA